MSFALYVLSKEATINGRHLRLVMNVCCVNKVADALLLINGRITPMNANPPRFWEVDTPAKAEAFFNRINLDAFAQGEPASPPPPHSPTRSQRRCVMADMN